MNRREQVKKAIHMENPEYIPNMILVEDEELSDIINVDVVMHFMGEKRTFSEWGFEWDRTDETYGQPKAPAIKEWSDIDKLVIPDPNDPKRFMDFKNKKQQFGNDRYYMAGFSLLGFTLASFIRGFDKLLEDLYLEPENVERLLDIVFGTEEEIIKLAKKEGFDGISLWDDYGMQDNMLIPPSIFRKFFKPRLKKQIALAHELGLDVFLHTCGYVYDIIPDFVEIGLDMLNLGQPNVNGIERVSKEFGGKICFVCPVSYQTTGISGTKDDIVQEIKDYIKYLGCFNGGLMSFIVNENKTIAMSQENYRTILESWLKLGKI